MSIRKPTKLNFNPSQVLDGLPRAQVPRAFEQVPRAFEQVPRTVEMGVHEAASRVAGAADVAGAQFGKGVARAGALGRLRPRIRRRRVVIPQVAVRPRGGRRRLGAAGDVLLRAQLARTSRQLAQESSDLGQTVDSLKSTVKAERRKSLAARRRRFSWNMALGAAVMYHLDPKSGGARRALTARGLKAAVKGARSLISSARRVTSGPA